MNLVIRIELNTKAVEKLHKVSPMLAMSLRPFLKSLINLAIQEYGRVITISDEALVDLKIKEGRDWKK